MTHVKLFNVWLTHLMSSIFPALLALGIDYNDDILKMFKSSLQFSSILLCECTIIYIPFIWKHHCECSIATDSLKSAQINWMDADECEYYIITRRFSAENFLRFTISGSKLASVWENNVLVINGLINWNTRIFDKKRNCFANQLIQCFASSSEYEQNVSICKFAKTNEISCFF